MVDDSEFLTSIEVAKYLRIPLSTVYKLTQDQKLPAFKVGKHWRYKRSSIQSWIDDLVGKKIDHSAISPSTLP
ncbi:MAG: helix-turn-helix domain-containing protein [Anaerolineae bacterium]|nr:helix-turn-helix domain-containing protein [Anaerolineae bacterium]